jgi:hypothetical protein
MADSEPEGIYWGHLKEKTGLEDMVVDEDKSKTFLN